VCCELDVGYACLHYPVSSVIPDAKRVGYEAADLLDRMMRGHQVSDAGLLIPPLGISDRSSTDTYAINDKVVAAALQFIREHARSGITVADVLRVVPLPKRKFIPRFKTLMHRTPHAEISRTRIESTKTLLHETDLTISEIAGRSGLASSTYLSAAFKKYIGVAPRAYRRALRPNHATTDSQKCFSGLLIAATDSRSLAPPAVPVSTSLRHPLVGLPLRRHCERSDDREEETCVPPPHRPDSVFASPAARSCPSSRLARRPSPPCCCTDLRAPRECFGRSCPSCRRPPA
jgi:AraC-like DNA-binding protein